MSKEVYYTPGGLPAIEEAGDLRVLGCLPPSPLFSCCLFEDSYEVLPESDWNEVDLSWLPAPVLDQGRTSSCVGHAACTAYTRESQFYGEPAREFSPYWIYGLINGGRDQGALIEDALTALKTYGVALKSEVPPGAMFPSQFPKETYEKAAGRKLLDGHLCRSFQDVATALTLNFPVLVGITVGKNFGQVDSEGVCPLPDVPLGGHALALHSLKRSPRHGWIMGFQNSWGRKFGHDGQAYLTPAHLPFHGAVHAFALESPFDDPSTP